MDRPYKSTRKPSLSGGLLLSPWLDGTRNTPVCARIEAFASHREVPGDWIYTQDPADRRGRFFRHGTAAGGLAFMPPEAQTPGDSSILSNTYYSVSAGAAWGAGTPDFETGNLLLGYSWADTLTGDLAFYSHDLAGAMTPAVAFTQAGRISFWSGQGAGAPGTLFHYNTAPRLWLFPDVSGTVVLTSDPDGLFTPDRVIVSDSAGLLNEDQALRWIASGQTLEVGLASGIASGAASGGILGKVRFFASGTAFSTLLTAVPPTADRWWQMPDRDGFLVGTALTGGIFTQGAVPFADALGLLDEDPAEFYWNTSQSRLGVRTNTPYSSLDLNGSLSVPTVTKTGDYTAGEQDLVILGDATAASLTITLPPAANVLGRVYTIKKIAPAAAAKTVTIDGNGSETIDGATTITIAVRYQSLMIVSDGSAWWTI